MSQYAQFFSWVGHAERTVEWAERAHELDPYRDDPRFRALLEQFDLPYEGA